MSQIRLYVDEDSMDQAFLQALRARGVDVRTAYEEGLVGRSDVEQLRWAATQGPVLYSFNVGDFYHLHTTFLGRQEDHATGEAGDRRWLQVLATVAPDGAGDGRGGA